MSLTSNAQVATISVEPSFQVVKIRGIKKKKKKSAHSHVGQQKTHYRIKPSTAFSEDIHQFNTVLLSNLILTNKTKGSTSFMPKIVFIFKSIKKKSFYTNNPCTLS